MSMHQGYLCAQSGSETITLVRVYNFSAGPAMLPDEVLERAQAELLDWRGGMSVLEVSHRGADFTACAAGVEQSLRELVGIPDDYQVLFLQGGAMGQFAAVPLNLASPGQAASYVITGAWGKKAAAEATKLGLDVNVVADQAATNYTTLPAPEDIVATPGTKYLHYTPNETIAGVEFGYVPKVGVPLVADMSSTILSRPIDVSRFGLIYAGTQKNMGSAGMAVVIVHESLLDPQRSHIPTIWNYQMQAQAHSMINTPPTFTIYLLGLIVEWVQANGGLAAMATRNQSKAQLLYHAIDDSGLYNNPVAHDARSWMNVVFTLAKPDLDAAFIKEANDAGLANLKGHRSVGGMRASIYNAMPIEGVQALVDFMADFERRNG